MTEAKVSIWHSKTKRNPDGYISKTEVKGIVPYYKHLDNEREIAGYLLKMYREHERLIVLRL